MDISLGSVDAIAKTSAVDQIAGIDDYDFSTAFGPGESWAVENESAVRGVFQAVRRVVGTGIQDHDASERLNKAILVYSYASLRQLPGYATLDYDHIRRIQGVIKAILEYRQDDSLQRPLNFLVLASPGAGKSQLVKSIAKKVGKGTGFVSFNMATMQSKDNFVRVLDAARNIVVDRSLPLVFLDEFDSVETNYPFLLPLLWDGELDVTNRDLRVGRSIFFLAGSRPTLPKRIVAAREMFESKGGLMDDDKLVDLFSRINGAVIEVPSLSKEGSIADKVVVAIHLLRNRFKSCVAVPRALLEFIAKAHFRYEARSIATLINLINCSGDAGNIAEISESHLRTLPLHNPRELKDSALAFHLVHEDGARGLIDDVWANSLKNTTRQIIRDEDLERTLDTPQWPSLALSILTTPDAVKSVAVENDTPPKLVEPDDSSESASRESNTNPGESDALSST
jgi:hypothetical protein